MLPFKLFRDGQLTDLKKADIKPLMDQITNPGAMFTFDQTIVVNYYNETLSLVQQEQIKLLIIKSEKGEEYVTKSKN